MGCVGGTLALEGTDNLKSHLEALSDTHLPTLDLSSLNCLA